MRKCSHSLVFAFALSLLATSALAQNATIVAPSPTFVHYGSGSITLTDTFQLVIPQGGTQNQRRVGCLIQNTGSNLMYVYRGAKANATKGGSFIIIPPATGVQGGSFSCATGADGVAQEEISITGTTSDTFTATWDTLQ